MRNSDLFCPQCKRYVGLQNPCPNQECQSERPISANIQKWEMNGIKMACSLDGAGFVTIEDTEQTKGIISAWKLPGHGQDKPLWRYCTNEKVHPAVVGPAYGGRVYLVARSGKMLWALKTSTGELCWQWEMPSPASAPTVHNDVLWMGSTIGNGMWAIRDANTYADCLWNKPTPNNEAILAAPLYLHDKILCATYHTDEAHVLSMGANNGRKDAYQHTFAGRAKLPLVHLSHPADGVALVAGEHQILALRWPDLVLRWRRNTTPHHIQSPILCANSLVFVAAGKHVLALQVNDGNLVWQSKQLHSPVTGLVFWRGLLAVAEENGLLQVMEATSGQVLWQHTIPLNSPLRLRPGLTVVEADSMAWWLVHTEKTMWVVPWHTGAWADAANWCTQQHETFWAEIKAPLCALAGQPKQAEEYWRQQRQIDRAAAHWEALNQHNEAAACYVESAKQVQGEKPNVAANRYGRAAASFELAGNIDQARHFRQMADRMGHTPALNVQMSGTLEVGMRGQLAFSIHNQGQAPAQQIALQMVFQGQLYQPAETDNTYTLTCPPDSELVFTLCEVKPVSAGHHEVKLIMSYLNGEKTETRRHTFSLDIKEAPPGTMVMDDIGYLKIQAPAGTPLPYVRINGMAGSIHYVITPS